MKEDIKITKTDFLTYLDAPMHLWADKQGTIDKTPTDFDIHLMNQGYEVENLAREYIKQFVLTAGDSVHFQKTFIDNEYEVRTDILVQKAESKSTDLYEIKSGTEIKKENYYDIAFQYLVVQNTLKIDQLYIVHLNRDYFRADELDLAQLFIIENVSEKVFEILDEVRELRKLAKEIVQSELSENIGCCLDPKTCPCIDLCHPDLPEYSIYDIPRLAAKKNNELLQQNIISIYDVPKSYPLSAKQRSIVDVAQSGNEFIDYRTIRSIFSEFSYPVYFLDYETCLIAIPRFAGYNPQQQVVFQYSLHRIDSPNRDPVHSEFLSITKDDPAKELVNHLCEEVGNEGTIFVWNKTFELTRNKEMANLYPNYANTIENINNRIFDLGDFVNYGFYLHPDFKGSWSIKNVLPVIAPELNYSEMEIGKGDQAMAAWWNITHGDSDQETIDSIREALLAYCELDTFAMVKIFQFLHDLVL